MAIYRKLRFAAAATTAILLATSVSARAEDGWVIKSSAVSVEKTADKLVAAVEKAGAKVFARVDHAAGAKSIDAELADMTMVMFGNPKIGTPILQAEPRAGLDLPNRVLIWDDEGQTKIGYLDPADLKARYKITGADKAFDVMTGALGKLTDAASQ
ncbi:hypothetical protein IMCC20628_02235 [Hoeflea sp. IMCC20628]|uniref:DUF302 domain-containing protein n=1 Tax=Hoeflea sp. IMCC20628 TaxID=1620421 RepID=UPI00063AAC61|nr:DUF302 domain-containing protein [Hoeflea sp. IMCC20628]AKI00938.1 hypothetical protein IMCC20628_02235 [Hoeflea sp. IMCC20628]